MPFRQLVKTAGRTADGRIGEDPSIAAARAAPPFVDFTCSDLQQLSRAVGRMRREIEFVSQDINRHEQTNTRFVYLLDFSELHAYLWPDSSRSENRALMQHLLWQPDLDFVLPPAAVGELLLKLHQLSERQQRQRQTVAAVLSNPFVAAFLEANRLSLDRDDPRQPELPTPDAIAQIVNDIREARASDSGLTRLAQLYAEKRLKPLTDFASAADAIPDPVVLQEAIFQLTSYRPTADYRANYADAHSYALASALSTKYCTPPDRTLFFFVTASPRPYAAFESIKWTSDPLFGSPKHLLRTSLVRHPVHLLYYSQMQRQRFPLRTLVKAKADLDTLHRSWDQVRTFARYVKDADLPPWTRVRLPRNQRYVRASSRFSAFYSWVTRPILALLSSDAAQEDNRRQLLGVRWSPLRSSQYTDIPAEISTRSTDDDRVVAGLLSSRSVLGLFDRLVDATERELQRSARMLKALPYRATADLDSTQRVFRFPPLQHRGRWNEVDNCWQYTAYLRHPRDSSAVLFGDRYFDYLSLWWHTNVDFDAFVTAARLFSQAVVRAVHIGTPGAATIEQEKAFSGFYFHTPDEMRSFPLDCVTDFRAGPILGLWPTVESLRRIRIAFGHGDLWYDFSTADHWPQRAGLLTHVTYADPITDLIQSTHSDWLPRMALLRLLDKIVRPATARKQSPDRRGSPPEESTE